MASARPRVAVWRPRVSTYSTFRNMLYIWHFDCNFSGSDPVLSDAIMGLAFDYRTQ